MLACTWMFILGFVKVKMTIVVCVYVCVCVRARTLLCLLEAKTSGLILLHSE